MNLDTWAIYYWTWSKSLCQSFPCCHYWNYANICAMIYCYPVTFKIKVTMKILFQNLNQGWSLFLPKIVFFSKTQYSGFLKGCKCSFYWKEWVFFLKSPRLLQKPLVFGKICILIIQNVCFQPFARFLDQWEAKSLEMCAILIKVKSEVFQIHLRQLSHFINVGCNYCLQPSLSIQDLWIKQKFFCVMK